MVRTLVPFSTRLPRTFGNLQEEMENLLDAAFRNESGGKSDWTPRMNISETDSHYEVTAELPGLKPDDVSVELEDGKLSISGQVSLETKA